MLLILVNKMILWTNLG